MKLNKTIRRYTPPLDFVTDIYVADDTEHCPAINVTDGSSYFPDRTKYATKIVPVVIAKSKDGNTTYGMECVNKDTVRWRAFRKGEKLEVTDSNPQGDAKELALISDFTAGKDYKLDEDGYSLLVMKNIPDTWSFYMTGSFVNPRTEAITPVKTPPVILTCAQQAAESFRLTADRPTSEVYDTLIDDSLTQEYATGVMQEGLTTADAHNRKVAYNLFINGSTKAIPQDDADHPWDLLVYQQSVNAQAQAVSTFVNPIISGTNNKPFDPLVSYQPNKKEVRYDALFADRAQFRICARDAKDCVTVSVCEASSGTGATAVPKTATAYIKDGKLYATNVEGSTALACTSITYNSANNYTGVGLAKGGEAIEGAGNNGVGLTLVAINLTSKGVEDKIFVAYNAVVSTADKAISDFLQNYKDKTGIAICIYARDCIRASGGIEPMFQLLAQYYGFCDTGTLNIMNPYRGYFALIATPRGGKRTLAETQYGWAWKQEMPSFEGKGIISGGDFDKTSQSTQGVKVLMDYRGQALTKPTIGLTIDWRAGGTYTGSGEQQVVNIPSKIDGDFDISCDVNRKGVAKVLSLDNVGNSLLTDEKDAILYTF